MSAEAAVRHDEATGEVIATGQRRPFSAWLIEQRGGALHADLTEALATVAAAVAEHEKQGSVTLKITVKPGEDTDYMLVSDEVKVAPPEPSKSPSLFYADSEGNLTRNNPRQQQLPLREVGEAKGGNQ